MLHQINPGPVEASSMSTRLSCKIPVCGVEDDVKALTALDREASPVTLIDTGFDACKISRSDINLGWVG